MDKFQSILIVGFLSYVYSSIVIKEMTVPAAIPINGTVDFADLDCNYEVVNESEIEVKWFFNGEYEQIYQWVPGYNNTGTGMAMLKDRLDPEYQVTNDTDTAYRGFRIKEIGRELSGNYTCKISGDLSETSSTSQMIIYSPAKSDLELILLNADALAVCTVGGIYPMPEVDFYIKYQNGTIINVNETVESDPDPDGFYNITATHDYTGYNHTLMEPTKFVCNVSIPGTPYFLAKELTRLGNIDDAQALINVTVEEDLIDNVTMTRNEIIAAEIVSTTPRDDSAMLQISTVLAFLLTSLLLLFK